MTVEPAPPALAEVTLARFQIAAGPVGGGPGKGLFPQGRVKRKGRVPLRVSVVIHRSQQTEGKVLAAVGGGHVEVVVAVGGAEVLGLFWEKR